MLCMLYMPFMIYMLNMHNMLNILGWVNPSKRGGMDGVFQGLAGQPCQPEENPVLPKSSTQLYILFPTQFFKELRSAGE